MAENNGLLIVGIIMIVLITAGLTYYVAKGDIPQGNQTNVTSPGTPPTITMRGDATKTVMPDLLTVGLTIEASGESASDAQSANAKEVAKIKAALLAAGVNASEIQTSSYYTNPIHNESCYKCGPYPMYDGGVDYAASEKMGAGVAYPEYYPMPAYPCRNDGNCSIIGYKTTHVILVESSNVNDGGKIIEAALGDGNSSRTLSASVDYIYFSLKEETRLKIEGELQAAAAANARTKADNIAKGLGAKIGKIISVMTDYNPYYPPYYVYQKDAMGGVSEIAKPATPPTEISPSDTSLSSSITVVFELVE